MDFVLWEELKKLTLSDWLWLGATVLLLAGLVAVLILTARKAEKSERANGIKRADLYALVCGGLCVALSFVLSYIKLFSMPEGGSITLASMLPLLWYAHRFGLRAGLLAGLAYGVLQFIQNPEFYAPLQVLLDYPLAFACIGLAGLFLRREDKGAGRNLVFLLAGVLTGSIARAACHIVSGAVFFAEYAPAGMNVWLYSLGYNGGYLGADTVICLVLTVPLWLVTAKRRA